MIKKLNLHKMNFKKTTITNPLVEHAMLIYSNNLELLLVNKIKKLKDHSELLQL